MGAIDFDVGKWLLESAANAKPANPAKVEAETTATLATFAALAGQDVAEPEPIKLPSDLIAGMDRLIRRQPPRISDPSVWPKIVADAERLVSGGWAAQAIALGWTLHDIFGVGPKDSWEYSGLAVWQEGRPILMLDEHIAAVRTNLGRAYFNRNGWGHGRDADCQPVLLWEYGL